MSPRSNIRPHISLKQEMNIKWVGALEIIVVTYSQFDSNIRVFYVFLGFLKNT
jgi:hypothetical protein